MPGKYKKTVYACYLSYITQAIVNNIAPFLFIIFQEKFGISYEELGRLVLVNFVTQIIVDIIGAKYTDGIGFRIPAVLANVFAFIGLILMGILPNVMPSPYIGLLIASIVFAIGGGLIEVIISPIVDSFPGEEKEAAMSLLHSFYCWGQLAVILFSTLILFVIGNNAWFVLPLLWSVIPLIGFFAFLRVPLNATIAAEDKIPLRKLLKTKTFRLSIFLMVCAGSSEIVMSQWSSLFAEKALGMSKVWGDILGPCLFAFFMGIGRVIYGIYGSKINLKKALLLGASFCIVCYLVTVFSQNPIIALLSCALTGLTVSLFWPGVVSNSARTFPFGGTTMFAVLALFGDLGCSIGPWMVGIVSDTFKKSEFAISLQTSTQNIDQLALKAGMLIAVIFPISMIIGLLKMKTTKEE